jgi:hypothetical protein
MCSNSLPCFSESFAGKISAAQPAGTAGTTVNACLRFASATYNDPMWSDVTSPVVNWDSGAVRSASLRDSENSKGRRRKQLDVSGTFFRHVGFLVFRNLLGVQLAI